MLRHNICKKRCKSNVVKSNVDPHLTCLIRDFDILRLILVLLVHFDKISRSYSSNVIHRLPWSPTEFILKNLKYFCQFKYRDSLHLLTGYGKDEHVIRLSLRLFYVLRLIRHRIWNERRESRWFGSIELKIVIWSWVLPQKMFLFV